MSKATISRSMVRKNGKAKARLSRSVVIKATGDKTSVSFSKQITKS